MERTSARCPPLTVGAVANVWVVSPASCSSPGRADDVHSGVIRSPTALAREGLTIDGRPDNTRVHPLVQRVVLRRGRMITIAVAPRRAGLPSLRASGTEAPLVW